MHEKVIIITSYMCTNHGITKTYNLGKASPNTYDYHVPCHVPLTIKEASNF